MENELRKEGERPPAHRDDGAGCSGRSVWASGAGTQPAWDVWDLLEPPGEGERWLGGRGG